MLHKIPNAFLPKSIFCGMGIAQKGNDLHTRIKSRDTNVSRPWTEFRYSILCICI